MSQPDPSLSAVTQSTPRVARLTPTRKLALGAMVLAVVGTFLPWVSAAGESATGVGLGGPGITILVCAAVAALLIVVVPRSKAAHIIGILAALLATIVAAGNLATLDDSGFVDTGFASIEPGLYLSVAGAVVWLVLAVGLFGQRLIRRR